MKNLIYFEILITRGQALDLQSRLFHYIVQNYDMENSQKLPILIVSNTLRELTILARFLARLRGGGVMYSSIH